MLVLALLTFTISCKRVSSADLAGFWSITNSSRKMFLGGDQKRGTGGIDLRADGTFVAFEVPEELLFGPPLPAKSVVSGKGVWKLESRETVQEVALEFRELEPTGKGVLPYMVRLNVSGGKAIRLSYFQGGDADLGRRIDFEKTE
jgi:hypothetical protein